MAIAAHILWQFCKLLFCYLLLRELWQYSVWSWKRRKR